MSSLKFHQHTLFFYLVVLLAGILLLGKVPQWFVASPLGSQIQISQSHKDSEFIVHKKTSL